MDSFAEYVFWLSVKIVGIAFVFMAVAKIMFGGDE